METIYHRENGDKIKIYVSAYLDCHTLKMNWQIYKCEKGKRKFVNVIDTENYTYRALNMEDRKKNEYEQALQFVTAEELYQAKLNYWQSLKPSL